MSVQLTKLFIEFVSELISENSSMMPDEVKKMLSSKENKARIENEFIKKNNIKQKKEKKTDTGEPKRPRTAYILFCQDEREHVTQANPGLANKDITSLLGKKWKEVKESFPRTFEQFNTVALREKSEYEEKMREYRTANNIPEKVKRVPKPKTSTVEKAKTPFFYYLKDKTIEFLIDRPSMKKKEINDEAKALWKELKSEKDDIFKKYKQIAKNKRDELSHVETPPSSPSIVEPLLSPPRTPNQSNTQPIPDTAEFPSDETAEFPSTPVRGSEKKKKEGKKKRSDDESENGEKKKKKKKRSNDDAENGEKKKKRKWTKVVDDDEEDDE